MTIELLAPAGELKSAEAAFVITSYSIHYTKLYEFNSRSQ